VTDRDGKTLISAGDAEAARRLTLHFADGRVDASTGESASTPPRVERARTRTYVPPQPGLFDSPASAEKPEE
jgi:exodeoxyribonuclease VII large subunit